MSASKWKPYSSYKDSDTFAKRIPTHWNELALKRVSSINDDTLPEDTNPMREMCYVDIGSVSYEDGITECEEMVFEKSPSRARRLANDGDVIVSTVRTYLKAICKIEKTTDEMVFSTGFAVVRPDNSWKKNSIGDFIVADYFVENVVANSNGVSYPAINASDLGCLKIIQPPLDEQEKIKQFLKTKISKMNSSISSLNTQIKRLEEKRSALIRQAITKGLDLAVPMKDSGIDWIGDVPQHWDSKKVKFVSKIFRGKFGHRPRNDPKLYDGNYPFVQTGNVARANKYITEYTQTLNDLGRSVSEEFPAGTIVMAIAANIGDVAILTFDACFPDSIVGFNPKPGMNQEYVYYSLSALASELDKVASQSTQQNLNIELVGNLMIPVPPETEQIVIGKYISEIEQTSSHSKEKIEILISKLVEYRTSLISSTVTGEIEVRGM